MNAPTSSVNVDSAEAAESSGAPRLMLDVYDLRAAYGRDETDEFITATTVGEEATIRPGDSVIAFNFRPDRMRQITRKLTETIDRYVTMAEYDEHWDYPVLFPPARPKVTIADSRVHDLMEYFLNLEFA